MFRSFSNRVFGGVCGGLGAATPLPARGWRVLFILLTLLTLGIGGLVYLLWWWLLPLDSPLHEQRGSALLTLLALIGSVFLVGGWLGRDTLADAAGAAIYAPLAAGVLGAVFFGKQLRAGRRGNVLLGVLALLVPVIALLAALGIFPAGIEDILLRSWSALLIIAGLSLALRGRVPAANVIALLVALGLTAGVAVVAFNSRAGEFRTDNTVTVAETLDDNTTTLQINLTTLDTDVRIQAANNARDVEATFTGSDNSRIEPTYDEENSLATLTLVEEAEEGFPPLEDIGRGTLQLSIPQDVALGVAYEGANGDANLDMAQLDLERLSFDLATGSALVTLPRYQPVSANVADNPGAWQVQDGNLRVVVPDDIGVRFVLNRTSNAEPRPGRNFDDSRYTVELEPDSYVITSRGFDSAEVRVRYIVDVPNGIFAIVNPDAEPDAEDETPEDTTNSDANDN